MSDLQPIILQGEFCKVVPLVHEHHDELVAAVKDGRLWELWYTLIPEPQGIAQEISRRLELQSKNEMLPFTIIDNKKNKAIGVTTFLNIDKNNHRVEIGGTWLCKSAQGMGINTEAKLLLLTHAFEVMDCNVVDFRTHILNHQSRKGIERLGAKLDGILRNHMVMPDSTLRDTCVYSIIRSEWSTVKRHLTYLTKNPSNL
jgi:N-acetyltransferase